MENQTQDMEVIHIEQKDTALYLITKAEIDTAITTAKAFPRSLTKFKNKVMEMATFSEDTAASCTYALPRSGKTLEGPSIRLAEIVASSYTNIRFGGRVIANDGKMITAQGVCIDLENNTQSTIEVNRKITDKNGITYTQDMQIVTGNAAIAIAVRNAIFKVIPSALIEDIYEQIKEVAKGTAETLVIRRDKAVNLFHSWGVTDAQLCIALKIPAIGDINLEKLQELTGFKTAIKNGETTVKELFETQAEAEKGNREGQANKASSDLFDKLKKDKEKK